MFIKLELFQEVFLCTAIYIRLSEKGQSARNNLERLPGYWVINVLKKVEHIHMDKRTSERGMNTDMYVNTRRKNNGTLRCEIFFLGSLRMSSF